MGELSLVIKLLRIVVDLLYSGWVFVKASPRYFWDVISWRWKNRAQMPVVGEIGELLDANKFQRVTGRAVRWVRFQQEQKEQKANSTERAWFEAETEDGQHLYVFAKCQAQDWKVRLMLGMFGVYQNEVRGYKALNLPIPHPTIYGAQWRPSRFVLVMEDLSKIPGLHFPNYWSVVVTREMARQVLSALARIHAAFWGGRNLPGGTVWDDTGNRPYQSFTVGFLTLWLANRRCPQGIYSHYVQETFKDALWHWVELRRYFSRHAHPKTVCHGDSHIGNFYLLPDQTVGTFDLQVLSFEHPMRDVAYFLTCSYPQDQLEHDEVDLLKFYLDELRRFGDQDVGISWENTWFHYRLWMYYALFAFVFSGGFSNLQDPAQTQIALNRVSYAMHRLQVGDVLNQALQIDQSKQSETK